MDFVSGQNGAWQTVGRTDYPNLSMEQGSISKDEQYVLLRLDDEGLGVDFNSRSKELYREIKAQIQERWQVDVDEDF